MSKQRIQAATTRNYRLTFFEPVPIQPGTQGQLRGRKTEEVATLQQTQVTRIEH